MSIRRRVDPNKLKHHPKNPNKHPVKQIDTLCKSIINFGWRHPIVVSKQSGFIICGHARKLAAIKLKCNAPVDYQVFKSESHELSVLMADNLIPELAEMDNELKLANLRELKLENISLETLGAKLSDKECCSELPEIPEIEIEDKISLERITLFIEESIKNDFIGKLKGIVQQYQSGLN